MNLEAWLLHTIRAVVSVHLLERTLHLALHCVNRETKPVR